MKKIVVLTSGLTHGGVNRTLLNSLEVLNEKYMFDIFALYSEGPYNRLFCDYNVITVYDISTNLQFVKKLSKKQSLSGRITRKITDFLTRINIHAFKNMTSRYIGRKLSLNDYDIVISFQEGYTTELATYVSAGKHIAWIHCDYSRYIHEVGRDESDIYGLYDIIVCVSEYTAGVFKDIVPSVAEKVVPIHNIMDSKGIIDKGTESVDRSLSDEGFVIVSVGRMDPVKRFSHIPAIARSLKNKGMKFTWYIIGDGGIEARTVREGIVKDNLENEVVMLGEQDNPFPYIRCSSVLVCLSSSEACPNVIREALILHTPVVTTDFPSSGEYIIDGQNGLICTIEDMSDVIYKLYSDMSLYNTIKSNLSEYIIDNTDIIEKIEALLCDNDG